MTSSIFTDWGDWEVSNLMFWRTLDLAVTVGAETAATDEQKAWADALRVFVNGDHSGTPFESYSPDVDVFEVFSSREEAGFWSDVFIDVAQRVFLRQLLASQDVHLQTQAVWAAYDLGRLLRKVANRPRLVEE